jgi:hypothetical protein
VLFAGMKFLVCVSLDRHPHTLSLSSHTILAIMAA